MTATLTESSTAAEVRAVIKRLGLTQGGIARETGLSASTVSRIAAGTYTAGDGAALAQVREHLNQCAGRVEARAPVALALAAVAGARVPSEDSVPSIGGTPWGGGWCTGGQRLMWSVLRAVDEDRELALVTGLSGSGKTYLLERYREVYPATLVYRPLRGISQSGLLEDLCRLLGVPYSGSNDTRRRRLLEAAAGRTLFIDEADLLVAGRYARTAVERLEIYRQLQERGAAVALVGLPALVQTVVTGGETYVFSRIGYARQTAAPTADELAAYWRGQMAGYPATAAKAGGVALDAARHGYMRYLDKLARRTRALDGDVAAAATLLFRGEQA